jgi:uncharacterized protein (TIGR02270 family)
VYELAADDEAPWPEELLRLAFRRFDKEGASRLRELAKQTKRSRDVVVAAGALGDPAVVPWLIDRMTMPDLARVAGEAFTEVTGAHFELDQLWSEQPQNNLADIDEDSDEEVADLPDTAGAPDRSSVAAARSADQDLYWPDVDKVSRWWARNKTRFSNGTRCLVGRDLTEENLVNVLQNGYQRHRVAAALELTRNAGQVLPEVRAPAYWKRSG